MRLKKANPAKSPSSPPQKRSRTSRSRCFSNDSRRETSRSSRQRSRTRTHDQARESRSRDRSRSAKSSNDVRVKGKRGKSSSEIPLRTDQNLPSSFKCDVCGVAFSTAEALHNHFSSDCYTKKLNRSNEVILHCDICKGVSHR